MSIIHTKRTSMKAIKSLVLVGALSLAACGQQLSGTYVTKITKVGSIQLQNSITFTGNKAVISGAEMDYKIEGNKIKLNFPMGVTMVSPIADDGSFEIQGERFYKRK